VVVVVGQEVFYLSPDLRMSELRKLGSVCIMSVCVSVFLPKLSGIQITSFMRHIILLFGAYLAVPCFSTLSHTRHDFLAENGY
jgi:hypothetical protein